MPKVTIRRLEEWVVAAHKARASKTGRSLEEELRVLLTKAAARSRQDCANEISKFRERMRKKYGMLSDSTPLIRRDREQRG